MSFNDIFKSNFLENVTSVSILDMAVALVLAFGLGIFIFLVYKKTYSGVMYSASFGTTLQEWRLSTFCNKSRASQMALVVKNLTASAGDLREAGSNPGSGRSPGGGNGSPLQYSCLEDAMCKET